MIETIDLEFQTLIGILQTWLWTTGIETAIKFQTLIGILQTGMFSGLALECS